MVNTTSNVYGELFQLRPSLFIFLLLSEILTIINIILVTGVIRYVRNYTNNRTIINQLMAFICWTLLGFVCIGHFESVRYFTKPVPIWLCQLYMIAKNTLRMLIIMTFDVIIVIKYVFILAACAGQRFPPTGISRAFLYSFL